MRYLRPPKSEDQKALTDNLPEPTNPEISSAQNNCSAEIQGIIGNLANAKFSDKSGQTGLVHEPNEPELCSAKISYNSDVKPRIQTHQHEESKEY